VHSAAVIEVERTLISLVQGGFVGMDAQLRGLLHEGYFITLGLYLDDERQAEALHIGVV
jgi:hypothetical protein